jgi:hypothetical protein
VQVVAPVEVMLTVDAVTAPVLEPCPNALTQSPTARAAAVADWVVLTLVDLVVVTFNFCVLGGVGFLVDFFEDLEVLFEPVRGAANPLKMAPVTDTLLPLTAVTFPDAIARLAAPVKVRPPPPWAAPPVRKLPPPGPPAPPPGRNVPWPPPAPPVLPPNPPPSAVQLPELGAGRTVIELAAMVVFDFLDFVPVTVTHSPAVMVLTVSVTTFEKVVVAVQLTVVCPEVGFCTSMEAGFNAATLPVTPAGCVVAAPAGSAASTIAAHNARVVAPAVMPAKPKARL